MSHSHILYFIKDLSIEFKQKIPESFFPHLERIGEGSPSSIESWLAIGQELSLRGYNSLAATAFRHAMIMDPELTIRRLQAGFLQDALRRHRPMAAGNGFPVAALAEAENRLGLTLEALGYRDKALSCYQNAVALQPEHVEALHNLGTALLNGNRHDAALAYFQTALHASSGAAESYADLGLTLTQMGRLGEAAESLRTGLQRHPDHVGLHFLLAEITRFSLPSPHMEAMEALLQRDPPLADLDRLNLHFALAKALEDCGEKERAFAHLVQGNAIKRRCVPYDEAATLAMLEQIQSWFSAERLHAARGLGHDSPRPVFIVGMPRSGSTLVEQILACHPMVATIGEIDILNRAVSRASRYQPLFPFLEEGGDRVWREMGEAYLAEIGGLAGPSSRVTDKMLSNHAYLGLIHLALPQARIIHTLRDPMDTCLSCHSRLLMDLPYTADLGALGRYYRRYESLMAHWRRVLPEGVMLDIRYEDVVADLEGQARRIIAHCGLPWDDACLSFHLAKRPVRTASAAQVRQPLYRSSVGRWRPDAALLAPLLRELGEPRG